MTHETAPVGVARRTAYALAELGLASVQRTTLRALLPAGTVAKPALSQTLRRRAKGSGGGSNRVTKNFQDALRLFDERGWIQRGEVLVQVLDPKALREHALADLTAETGREHWLNIEAAIAKLTADQSAKSATPGVSLALVVEQRRQELIALHRLMTGSRGDRWSGRGAVQFLPKGSAL